MILTFRYRWTAPDAPVFETATPSDAARVVEQQLLHTIYAGAVGGAASSFDSWRRVHIVEGMKTAELAAQAAERMGWRLETIIPQSTASFTHYERVEK